jgi:hypothetical protein
MSVQDVASVLSRITAVGTACGIDVASVIERAARSDLALARMCRIGVDGAGTHVRVMALAEHGARDSIHRDLDIDSLAAEAGRSLAELAPAGELAIELSAMRGGALGVATCAYGRWERADTLAAVSALAPLDDAQLAAFTGRLEMLAGAGVRTFAVVTRFRPPAHHSVEVQLSMPTPDPGVAARLVALVDAMALPPAQRDLIAGLGPVFGERSRPTMIATVHASAGGMLPRLGVTWRAAPFELILRVLVGVGSGSGDEVGHRVGALAGALGTSAATAFEMVLSPGTPAAHVDVDLVNGKVAS